MKILHLINRLSMGGAQSLVVEIAKVQKENGNDVEVMQLFDSPDRTFPNRLSELEITLKSLSTGSMYSPLHIFRIIPLLNKYDVIHVHLFPSLYWAGFAKLLSFSKTVLIFTEHNTTNRRRGNLILRVFDKLIYKNAYNEIVACADRAYDTFVEYYKNIRNISSINNGIDTARYRDANGYSLKELIGTDEDLFVATMVARYTYPKRQDTIVEAISKLPPRFHAVLVGSKETDPEAIRLRKLCDKLGVSDRVHSLYIRKDVPQILKTSNAIIMSSEYEGLSLSSLEGMATGIPFIANNVNGLREVVKDAGILFELGDSDELASILLKLDSDQSFYSKIARQCYERAMQFDIHNVVEKYMDVYKKYVK